MARTRPNILIVITDQQRAPMHWPTGQWLRELMPAQAEIERTGLSFRQACTASAMCSPSRASLLTGLRPSRHGVSLTLTDTGARPDPRELPQALRWARRDPDDAGVPRSLALRQLARTAVRARLPNGPEPVLDPATPNLARILAAAGYHVAYKGKWHLSRPAGRSWSHHDGVRVARDYGFQEWEPPDAGEDILPEHFGGGRAGPDGRGWDEAYTRQAERFLTDPDLPEPFALVVSLVNPHDVLAYPSSWARGGYDTGSIADMGVALPPTYDEQLAGKPFAHGLQRMGQGTFLGSIRDPASALEYVNFYAHLHSVADARVGRLLHALGDPGDPRSLRARTLIVRLSDHGEMGLSHGGLRQKMFNAYEETIRVPLVFSNPLLFPRARETAAPASLIDLVPTLATIAGADGGGLETSGADLTPVLAHHSEAGDEALDAAAVDLGPVARHPHPRPSVQDGVLFTFDDHKAGTALPNVIPQPNRLRVRREPGMKYALYIDPSDGAAPQHEMYDLAEDPHEAHNLVDLATGAANDTRHAEDAARMRAALAADLRAAGMDDDPAARD